jgi:hypothetical protein
MIDGKVTRNSRSICQPGRIRRKWRWPSLMGARAGSESVRRFLGDGHG